MHIWSLSQCLLRLGHQVRPKCSITGTILTDYQVIVVTHAYGNRAGVRYMTNGLKVYYTPMTPFVDQDSFPTFSVFFPLFRNILIREKITIVHGHQVSEHDCLY